MLCSVNAVHHISASALKTFTITPLESLEDVTTAGEAPTKSIEHWLIEEDPEVCALYCLPGLICPSIFLTSDEGYPDSDMTPMILRTSGMATGIV